MVWKRVILSFSILCLFGVTQGRDLWKIIDLDGPWKFSIGDRQEWAAKNFDDQYWETIDVPGAWENQGFNGFNGYAWYRRSFDGKDLRGEENIYLNLGYIDDSDEVYVNGNLVGFSGGFPPDFHTAYTALRIYYIPNEFLNFEGKNTIAIRVFDVVHSGGIISGDIGLYTPRADKGTAYVLEGIWKFSDGDDPDWRLKDFDDSDWGDILVPGWWKNRGMGIKEFYDKLFAKSTYAWYRRKFELPERLKGKSLILVLGKIDDFDEVYLNGKLIGVTNDGLPFGRSGSWQQTRVYPLPPEYLNEKGENVIAVRVTDVGDRAGIYQGPIGIVEQSSLGQFVRSGGY